jgi:hypothetical protein
MSVITGIVGNSGKYLVTGMPVDTQVHAAFKITFENNTSGTNLGLYEGTYADFSAPKGGTQLSGSGGPGHRFLTIIDAQKLSGKIIFVRRDVGTADSEFTLTIE